MATGVLLFIKNATTWATSVPFLIKMSLVIAGVATVLPLRSHVLHSHSREDREGVPVRFLAIASILVWAAAVTAGRLLAYLIT